MTEIPPESNPGLPAPASPLDGEPLASIDPPPLPPDGALPPLLPVTAANLAEPPPLPATPAPAKSHLLMMAAAFTALVELVVSIRLSGEGLGQNNIPYRIGLIMGGAVIWPLIVIGLFSIGRRFRNNRSRAIILIVVMGLEILSQLGQLIEHRSHFAAARPAVEKEADDDEADDSGPSVAEADKSGKINLTPPARKTDFDFSPGSLLPAIGVHALNNLTVCLGLILLRQIAT